MDTKLEGQYPQKAAYTVAIIALQCISEAKIRPQMSEVLAALEHLPAIRPSASPSREDKSMQSPMREGLNPPVKLPLRHNNHHQQNPEMWNPKGKQHVDVFLDPLFIGLLGYIHSPWESLVDYYFTYRYRTLVIEMSSASKCFVLSILYQTFSFCHQQHSAKRISV